MINYKCKNCGGEFEVHTHGELFCPFCGSKQYFSDRDFKGYEEYRESLLQFLKNANDEAKDEGDILNLWNYTKSVVFNRKGGGTIEVSYTFQSESEGVKFFVGRDKVIYYFPKDRVHLAQKMLDRVESIGYPSADVRNLRKFLPSLMGLYDLENSEILLVIEKPENVYPLFAFSDLEPETVAWMVSRMENFCCLLEFNDMDFRPMDTRSIYINPKTHEAYLFGCWWNAKKTPERQCLKDLRRTAGEVTGNRLGHGPKEFSEFLDSVPKDNAFDDFAYWDTVIEKGFGGHHFTDFNS